MKEVGNSSKLLVVLLSFLWSLPPCRADQITTISTSLKLVCVQKVEEASYIAFAKNPTEAASAKEINQKLSKFLSSLKRELKRVQNSMKNQRGSARKSAARKQASLKTRINETSKVIKSIAACLSSAPLPKVEGNNPVAGVPTCGNRIVEADETCDDGNTLSGDCCSARCQLEPVGAFCNGSSATTPLCAQFSCSLSGSCVQSNEGRSCSDGNACSLNDLCKAGSCVGTTTAGTTKTCGVGACQRTVTSCVGAPLTQCIPGSPTVEVCNGIDDDCDGLVDEGLATTTVSCGFAACTSSVPSCSTGNPNACQPDMSKAVKETCNGKDDDCDGVIDEDAEVRAVLATLPHVDVEKSACSSGKYKIACTGRTADVDGKWENGCEVDLNSSVDNCGAVGYQCDRGACVSSSLCVQGQCRAIPRLQGWTCDLVNRSYCLSINGVAYSVGTGFGECDGSGNCVHKTTYCPYGCGITGTCNSF